MPDSMGPAPTTTRWMPGGGDPNVMLLRCRLLLWVALVGTAFIAWYLDRSAVCVPGLMGALGFSVTALAVSWAAGLARAPQRMLLVAQVGADAVVIGLLVHFTGGPFSIFPLAFCVPIILAAAFLDARWAAGVAGVASALTGGSHFGLAVGWLWSGGGVPISHLSGWPVLVTATQIAIFALTAMISADFSRRLLRSERTQQRTNARVHRSQAEVRNILDNISSGLLTVDTSAVVTRVNPACCRILGVSEADLLYRNLRYAMAGGMESLADIITSVAEAGQPVRRGEVTVQRDGLPVPLGLNVNHVLGAGDEIIGAIAIFADLTHEKELVTRVREADRMAGVGELAASIAHEIRNPLASIRGSAELLADELVLEGDQQQLFELVLRESGRVNTIITDFLAYSRMGTTLMAPFDGQAWCEFTQLQVRQHVMSERGQVTLTCEVEPKELVVVADEAQLTQMVLNLVINSCQAMNYCGEMNLHLARVGRDCDFELTVQDTGPGIDDEIRAELFRPFTTTKPTGTGLGLSIAARIADGHGGTIRAGTNAGGGAEFIFRWPGIDIDAVTPGIGVPTVFQHASV